jgi:hypothetical protein
VHGHHTVKMIELQRRNGPLGLHNLSHELELTGTKLNRNFLSLLVLGDTWQKPISKLPSLQVVGLSSRELDLATSFGLTKSNVLVVIRTHCVCRHLTKTVVVFEVSTSLYLDQLDGSISWPQVSELFPHIQALEKN